MIRWIFIIFLSAFFYVLKFLGPSFIQYLYNQQAYVLLNRLAFVNSNQSLDFYLGQIEWTILGPISSLISGLILLSLCLRYLKSSSSFKFGISILVYFCLTRFEVLIDPPFGESMTGLFYEATWLIQNKLDYLALHHQGLYNTGGPQFYPTSLYPLFIAWMMHLIKPQVLFFIVMHLLTFVLTAVLLSCFRSILRRYFDDTISLLTVLLLLFYPLSQSMVELINLETSLLFFIMSSLYFLVQKKFGRAFLFSVCAMLVKGSGIIASLTVFACGILALFIESDRKQKVSHFLWGLGAFTFAILKTAVRNHFMGEQPINNQVQVFSGWFNVIVTPWFWLYAVSLITLCWFLIQKKKQNSFRETLLKCYVPLVIFIITGTWFFMFFNYNVIIYRYQHTLMPFMLFCIIFTLTVWLEDSKRIPAVIMILIVVFLSCSYGLPYRTRFVYSSQTACMWKRQPSCLERSLEYRNYLKLEKKVVDEMEANFSDFTIGAPWGAAQAIGVPEMGYAKTKLNVMPYGMLNAHLGLSKFTKLSDYDLTKTVWIGFKHDQILDDVPYPIDPRDKVLKKIEVGDINAYIFMGGFGIEKMRIISKIMSAGLLPQLKAGNIKREYLDNL